MAFTPAKGRINPDGITLMIEPSGTYSVPAPGNVRRLFDGWEAEGYTAAASKSDIYVRFFSAVYRHAKDLSSVLDVACGSGLSGEPFINLLGSSVDGVDLYRPYAKMALDRGYRHVRTANLLSSPLPPGPYPTVIALGLIGEYQPLELVLPKMIDVAAPASTVAFSSLARHTTPAVGRSLQAILSDKGYTLVSSDLEDGWKTEGMTDDRYLFVVATREG